MTRRVVALPPFRGATTETRAGAVAMPRRDSASAVRCTAGTGDPATATTDAGGAAAGSVAPAPEQADVDAARTAARIHALRFTTTISISARIGRRHGRGCGARTRILRVRRPAASH